MKVYFMLINKAVYKVKFKIVVIMKILWQIVQNVKMDIIYNKVYVNNMRHNHFVISIHQL